MPVWSTRPLAEQPELVLLDWSIHEINDDGERSIVLVGYCLTNSEGRVSSEVVHLDIAKLIAKTSSGRIYRLEGPPGNDGDAAYVFVRYKQLYRLEGKTVDVTSRYYDSHLTARGLGSSRSGVH